MALVVVGGTISCVFAEVAWGDPLLLPFFPPRRRGRNTNTTTTRGEKKKKRRA